MVKKKIVMLLCMTLTLVSLMGCQSGGKAAATEQETATTAASRADDERPKVPEDGSIMGQVTAIDGDNITLNLVKVGERPEGEMKEHMTEADGEVPQPPTKEDEEAPEPQEDEAQMPEMPEDGAGGSVGGGFSLSGEEQVITVTAETTYTIEEKGEERTGTLSDITQDSMLRVVMDGDTVVSITIINQI